MNISSERAEEIKKIWNKFYDELSYQSYQSSGTYIAFNGFIDSLVAPEYPCPACGEEMVVRFNDIEDVGICGNPGCIIFGTCSYPSKEELSQALMEYWEGK